MPCVKPLVCDMEMKGSYKSQPTGATALCLVCDMEMKGSYKGLQRWLDMCGLVCDMEMKGSYKKELIKAFYEVLYVTCK